MTGCRHEYGPSTHDGYERCVYCGTEHSTSKIPLRKVYEEGYWANEEGRSSLKEQVFNVDGNKVNGLTKCEFVLSKLPLRGRSVLEIACAPGIMLRRMAEAGVRNLVGIEIDATYLEWLREIAGPMPDFLFGYFPQITANLPDGRFELIIATDIFEHVHCPEAFLSECARLTRKGGDVAIMSPMLPDELEERFYDPKEHIYLHARENVQAMASDAGLRFLSGSRWDHGHDLMIAEKL